MLNFKFKFDQAMADGFGEYAMPKQVFNSGPEEFNGPMYLFKY